MPRSEYKSPSAEPQKRVTLQDIADAAGVKKMVVSNALNGTRSVAPATKARVQRIAREMNYVPNFSARALTTGRTGLIAIMSGKLCEPYYASMVDLLTRHAADTGFHLVLARTRGDVRELVNATNGIAVDGAIAVDMQGLANEFKAHPSVPCVSISTYHQSFIDSVVVDLSVGVREAVGLMVCAGRQRIAYLVTAPTMEIGTEVRTRAYLEVIHQAGRKAEIINVDTNFYDEVEANFTSYLEQKGCPDALLCQNDLTAMCAFRVLKRLGYKIPQDVLLAGCDGHPHMEDFDPPLSTIAQPMEELCAAAWQFLHQRIAQPSLPLQYATFQGQLVVRQSLLP